MPTYCIDLTAHNTLARHRGVGRYAIQLARAMSALRSELLPDERLVAVARVEGTDTITEDLSLAAHTDPLPAPDVIDRHYFDYFAKHRKLLPRTLARLAPDVVHYVEGPVALASDRYRSVVTCHDLIPILFPKSYLKGRFAEPLRRARDHATYQRADRNIAVSFATAHDLERIIGVPRQRISVIHQGVDHARFHPEPAAGESAALRRDHGVPERYIVYVGANDPRKRVPLLLDAQASAFRFTGLPLVIAGTWTSRLEGALKRRLRSMPKGSVVLTANLPSGLLPALYRGAVLHALPSIYEGFGLTVLEALACGCPVISTRGGSLSEVGGDAPAYVREDDLGEFESTLIRVATSDELRARMRARGLVQARRFDWASSARATLEVYRWAAGLRVGPVEEGAVTADPVPAASFEPARHGTGAPLERRGDVV